MFSEWILLNQTCIEELGFGLRELCQHKTNPIYKQLAGSFKEGFMNMTAQDEDTLQKHKKAFQQKKKIYECAAFILSNLDLDHDWGLALQCYQFHRTTMKKKEE